jgi:hypothetical protein
VFLGQGSGSQINSPGQHHGTLAFASFDPVEKRRVFAEPVSDAFGIDFFHNPKLDHIANYVKLI